MDVSQFNYHLPPELIAQHPVEKRDASKLLIYDREKAKISEDIFRNISDYLRPGDVLVINDTMVRPARIIGRKTKTGGRIEATLLQPLENPLQWSCLAKPGRRLHSGDLLSFGSQEGAAFVVGDTGFGGKIIEFSSRDVFEKVINEVGQLPLPPYIKEPLRKNEEYQTVYAKHEGSVAAPTAGLHFTAELLDKCREKFLNIVPITLHIGLGTFKPVTVVSVEDHRMHSEFVSIDEATAALINEKKLRGERIIAVGTTVARTLESFTQKDNKIEAGQKWTDLFIYPGYSFKIVDGLLTNFHLPRSTLLMMVCAFGGYKNIMELYEYAVQERYRFFSFGDAMLIL